MRKMRLFWVLGLMMTVLGAKAANELYCKYNSTKTQLVFWYDDKKSEVIDAITDWKTTELKGAVKTVIFTTSMRDYASESFYEWFYGFSQLTEVIGMENLNTSLTTSFAYMFYNCSSLTSIDISTLDLSSAKNVYCMFAYCTNLKTIYRHDAFPSTLTNANQIFLGCTKLVGGNGTTYDSENTGITRAKLDVDGSNGYFTDNLPKIYTVFDGDSTLTYYYDNQYCQRTGTIDFYQDLNIGYFWRFVNTRTKIKKAVIDQSMKNASFTTLDYLFYSGHSATKMTTYPLTSLKEIEGLNYINTANVTSLYRCFYQCQSLEEADLSTWDLSNVTSVMGMFYQCKKLQTIYCEADLTGATKATMFGECGVLKGGKGTQWNSSNIDNAYARIDEGPSSTKPGYFTSVVPIRASLQFWYDDLKYIYNNRLTFGIDAANVQKLEAGMEAAKAVLDNPTASAKEVIAAEKAAGTLRDQAVDACLAAAKEYEIGELAKKLTAFDSDACKQIVADAQAQVNALTVDKSQKVSASALLLIMTITTLDGNVDKALALQRAKEGLKRVVDDLNWMANFSIAQDYEEPLTTAINDAWDAANQVYTNASSTADQMNTAATTANGKRDTYLQEIWDNYKDSTYVSLDVLLKPDDSDACKKIVADAKKLVNDFALDLNKTAKENIDAFDAVFTYAWWHDDIKGAVDDQRNKDHAMGMETVESGKWKVESQKVIRDGQVYIMHNGHTYTLTGQKIQ